MNTRITLKNIWPSLLIIAVGILCYSNSFHGPFVFDDHFYIIQNTALREPFNFKQMYTALSIPSRVVGSYSFALNYAIGGLNVSGYHVLSLAIHLGCALFLMGIVPLIFKAPQMRSIIDEKQVNLIALICALLFVSHPIQTQAVTYITQRFASLATFFYLGSIYFYLKARLIPDKKVKYFALTVFSAILAMFTKETAFTLPIVIGLSEFFFFSDLQKPVLQKKVPWKYIGVAFVLLLFIPGLFVDQFKDIFFGRTPSHSHQGDYITVVSYALTQLRVIPVYIRLLFFPVGQNFDYDFPVSKSLFDPIPTLFGLIFILAWLALAAKLYRKHRLISFGIFWFFITSLVESSIIPIRNVIYEHRVYLPLAGFSIAAASVLSTFIKNRRALLVAVSVIVCVLSALTFQRNKVWQSVTGFWEDAARKSPNKARPYGNLGRAYFEEGNYDKALALLDKAIELNPSYRVAYNNRGKIYFFRGEYEKALRDYSAAILINPSRAGAYTDRGNVYRKFGRMDKALEDFTTSLEKDPEYAAAYNNRAPIYRQQGRLDLALADLNKAIELAPQFPQAYTNRGNIYIDLGRIDLALKDYNKSLSINPNDLNTLNNRGRALRMDKQYAKALADYEKVISINPRFFNVHNNRATVLAELGQIDLAIKDLQKELTFYPNNTLAAENLRHILSVLEEKEEGAQKQDKQGPIKK